MDLTTKNQTTTPAPGPLSPQPLAINPQESSEEGLVTVLSSGYGTLSAWEAGLEAGQPSGTEGKDEVLQPDSQIAAFHIMQPDYSLPHSTISVLSLHGQERVPSRNVPPSDVSHTSASTVPSPSAEKQRLNRWVFSRSKPKVLS